MVGGCREVVKECRGTDLFHGRVPCKFCGHANNSPAATTLHFLSCDELAWVREECGSELRVADLCIGYDGIRGCINLLATVAA